MPRIEPAVTTLWYSVADGVSYIDIAKDLSIVNRRLYRQGMVYAIQDVQVGLAPGMKVTDVWQAAISGIPNSWIAHNAWKKAFTAWRRQVSDYSEVSSPGTWNDFKIYLDDDMEDSGTILTPVAGDGAAWKTGDWDYSALVFDDDGTEKDLKMHMIGSSNLADTNEESGIGLINEYQNSRALVHANDPDMPAAASDTIYAKLLGTDEMTDRIVDNIESANDNPPYDQDEYPGGHDNGDSAQAFVIMAVSGSESVSRAPGFVAPCGLIKISTNELASSDATSGDGTYTAGSAATALVGITVATGPYRGVLATPMGQ